jgi:hypothetical protein
MKVIVITAALSFSVATLAAAPAVPTFKAVDVDTSVKIGYGVTTADVNGDKKPDILLADKDLIVWYENPNWKKHVIAEKLTPIDHVCIAAMDIDGDGKCEIAAGAGWNPNDTTNSGALFYLVPPADRTQKWEPVALPHEPTIHRIRWVKIAAGKFDLVSVPLHGRGNKPATGEGEGVKIFALEKPANPKDSIQWDKDDEHELLVASKEGVYVLNPRQGRVAQQRHLSTGAAGEVRLGKLGDEQRFFATIEPMHGNTLCAYTEPKALEAPGLWTRRVLDESLVDGHALACGDLAGSGSDQIVVGWRAMNRPGVKVGLKLFTATDKTGEKWGSTVIDDNTMACEDLCLADLDGDGKLDIIAAGRATKNLKVYFNQGVH